MMTRKEYMTLSSFTNGEYDSKKGAANLRSYYSQFVNDWVLQTVAQRIGAERLRASRDPHFNDIPLPLWDGLPGTRAMEDGLKACGDYLTLSGKTCIYKTAARMWLDCNPELTYRRGRMDYANIRDQANNPDTPSVEVTADELEEMLGCVPPIYVAGGFLVGEAVTGDERGTVYANYAERDGKCFARYAVKGRPETYIR